MSQSFSFSMQFEVNPPAKYKLKTEEGQVFLVDRKAMKASAFINQYFIDNGWNDRNCRDMVPVPVPFPTATVELVIRWLNHHQDDTPSEEKLPFTRFPAWDKNFFKMEPSALFSLLNASHHLGIEELMNMGCCAAAEMIRGKSTAEIRRIYNIKSDDQSTVELLTGAGDAGPSEKAEQAAEAATQQNKPKQPQQQQKKSKKQKKKRH